LSRFVKQLRHLASRLTANAAHRTTLEVPITSRDEAARWTQWGGYGEALRLLLPTDALVMQGGIGFGDPSHPFVAAIREGCVALETYYSRVQPKSLVEWHQVDPADPRETAVPAWEVPWIERVDRLPPPGECGLVAEHGVSFYGPVTREKLSLEYRRLTSLAESIAANGYRPDRHGDIDGYFMFDEDSQFRFFVRGGKHRAAALAATGTAMVPVAFKQDWPRHVALRDSPDWPLVRDGQLSESVARQIFLKYFDS